MQLLNLTLITIEKYTSVVDCIQRKSRVGKSSEAFSVQPGFQRNILHTSQPIKESVSDDTNDTQRDATKQYTA